MTPFSVGLPLCPSVTSVVKIFLNHRGHRVSQGKPRTYVYQELLRTSGKRQQGNIPRLLDRSRQTALVRHAHAGQASWRDLAAFRYELRQQTHIFVIDRLDLLDAELANFFAPEVLTAAFPRTARAPAGTRTAWPAALGAITATTLRPTLAA